jgi:hypothetical protein
MNDHRSKAKSRTLDNKEANTAIEPDREGSGTSAATLNDGEKESLRSRIVIDSYLRRVPAITGPLQTLEGSWSMPAKSEARKSEVAKQVSMCCSSVPPPPLSEPLVLQLRAPRSVLPLSHVQRRAAPPQSPAECSRIKLECQRLLSSSFSAAECRKTILPLAPSSDPSHLRRTIVTTVLISQNDPRQASSVVPLATTFEGLPSATSCLRQQAFFVNYHNLEGKKCRLQGTKKAQKAAGRAK